MSALRCASEVNEEQMLAKRAPIAQASRPGGECRVCRKCNRPMYACRMRSPNDSVEWRVKADEVRRHMTARTAGQTPTYVTAPGGAVGIAASSSGINGKSSDKRFERAHSIASRHCCRSCYVESGD